MMVLVSQRRNICNSYLVTIFVLLQFLRVHESFRIKVIFNLI